MFSKDGNALETVVFLLEKIKNSRLDLWRRAGGPDSQYSLDLYKEGLRKGEIWVYQE